MIKLRFTLVILLIIGFFTYLFIENERVDKFDIKQEFQGIVEDIAYDEKNYPSVLIKGEFYPLSFANDGDLKIGDSIVKSKNDEAYFQYRNGICIHSY